jgi:hypothetical protein
MLSPDPLRLLVPYATERDDWCGKFFESSGLSFPHHQSASSGLAVHGTFEGESGFLGAKHDNS